MPRSPWPWCAGTIPAQGLVKLRRGRLGETTTRDGSFEAELRGLVDALKQEFGQVYGPTCRADLGDGRCGIDLPLHVQTAAITAVLGQDSFTLAPGARHHQADPRRQGRLEQRRQRGVAVEIRGYDGGRRTLELFVPPPFALAVGDAPSLTRPATSGSRPARRSGTTPGTSAASHTCPAATSSSPATRAAADGALLNRLSRSPAPPWSRPRARYLGTPFRHQGRGDALDCVGLAFRVARDLGLEPEDRAAYGRQPHGLELRRELDARLPRSPRPKPCPATSYSSPGGA